MAGTGRIGNATLVSSGNRLRPGVPGFGGTLTTGNVSAGSADVLVFDLISPSVFGKLNVTGTVKLNNATLSLLPAPSFTTPIGTVFEIVTNDGADAVGGVVSSTFQGLPQGATVSAGSRNFTISYTGGTGNDITLTVANTLDIDGDGKYLAETDGLLIARYINGIRGPALIANAVATAGGAKRTSESDIELYLQSLGFALDVTNDVNGTVDATDALLITRWMFGFRGEGLVSGTTTPSSFPSRSQYITNTEGTLRLRMP